jgi:methionine sulfoxide reductase heme-binding subunit
MILNNRLFLWAVLAIPALLMLGGLAQGRTDSAELLHPSGETSARLMIIAMMIGPLTDIIGRRRWLQWLLARRRYVGVAAFCYALLHLIFYIIDMGNLADMIAELPAPGIWTAWVAMVLMTIPAVISNDTAMRWLRARWKAVQRLVYPAALLTLLHWGFVHNGWTGALVHFAPLALLYLARLAGFRVFQPQGV